MDISVRPLADRVLVKPAEAETTTKSGIIIPDAAKEKPLRGTVVAAGDGKVSDNGSLMKLQVKPGDEILYGKYSGTEITVDGNDYLLMRESDILAIVSK